MDRILLKLKFRALVLGKEGISNIERGQLFAVLSMVNFTRLLARYTLPPTIF